MRYVVIFKAQIKHLDDEYFQMAQYLREKALSQFKCQKFESICENDTEIALSYWNSLEDIKIWHQDAEHKVAQKLGKEKWYLTTQVNICELIKTY